MLSEISWTLFLTAIFVVGIMYYSFIAICYYPKEVLTFLLGKKNQLPPGAALQHLGPPRESLMGSIQQQLPAADYLKRYQPPVTDVTDIKPVGHLTTHDEYSPDAEDEAFFMVASDVTNVPVIETGVTKDMSPDALLVGNVSDLMESIRTLLRVIQDGEGDKNDVINFFPSLLAQYPRISDSKYRYSINAFIRDNCLTTLSEDLSLEDINDLWCFPYPPQAA